MQFLEEPIRGHWKNGDLGSVPCLLLGIMDSQRAAICTAEGEIQVVPLDRITLDWRFDTEKGRWIDVGAPEEPEGDDGEEAQDQG